MKVTCFSFPVKFSINSITFNNNNIKFKKRKKKNNRGIVFSNPPGIVIDGDLVVHEILTRLPVKSLFRFKSVCKHWNSTIEKDRNFIDLHFTRSKSRNPSLFILVRPPKGQSKILTGDLIESCTGREVETSAASIHTINTTMTCHADIITNSINGLICFIDDLNKYSSKIDHIIRLYNISTREESLLSTPPLLMEERKTHCLNPIYRFGHDHATNEYKLVCTWTKWLPDEGDFEHFCEVLTIEGGRVDENKNNIWRRIDDPPHQVDDPSVYVNGSIYWSTRALSHGWRWQGEDHRPVFIVAFDVGSEKFRTIPVPDFILDEPKEYSQNGVADELEDASDRKVDLLEVGGRVALQIKVHSRIVKLWIYDDRKKENTTTSSNQNWSEMTINLPFNWDIDRCVQLHAIFNQIIIKTYFPEDSRRVFNVYKEMKKKKKKQDVSLYSFDLRKNTFTKFEIRGIPPCIPTQYLSSASSFTTFVESLLPLSNIEHGCLF